MNTRLPEDIVVVKATEVPDGFNAIGSCLKKEYTYRIYNSRMRNAFYVNRAWFYPKRLDETVMQRAAAHFVGTHDFAAVRSVGTETRTTVRTVHYFQYRPQRRPDRVPGVRRRLSLQHGAGHGGHLRLRRRRQILPRGRARHSGRPQPHRRRAHRTRRGDST